MITSPLNGKRVLVVDDEEDLRDVIGFDLKRRGCMVLEASCGDEAIGILQREPIDIVVSDVRMPKGNGVDLLKRIRSNSLKTPIVLLATGFADLTEQEALQMGAHALIEKPISRLVMLKILESSVGQAELKTTG